jgi:uncharacterized protein (DUF1697 family)
MGRFVVLLRGVNVGRAKRVPMAELRDVLDGLGFTDVRTVLNSGNAVVTGPDGEHATRIEVALAERFGFEVRVVVLTAGQLREIVAAHPFVDVAVDGSRMMAHVLDAPPQQPPAAADPEHARLVGQVVYQWCPDGLLAAPPVAVAAPTLVTTRNWNTITRLHALL